MPIVQEKPKTIAVLKSKILITGQKTKKIDKHFDSLKIYSCLKEFETANFETQTPKMNLLTLSNSKALPESVYSPKNTGLTFLNLAVKKYPESRLELNEHGSLVDIVRKIEAHSSRFGIDSRK